MCPVTHSTRSLVTVAPLNRDGHPHFYLDSRPHLYRSARGGKYAQFSSHRAKFHNALIAKAREVLGEEHVILDHVFVGMDREEDGDSMLSCADNASTAFRQCGGCS